MTASFEQKTNAKKATMISPYQASIIDRLREAAKEHGEVAGLLGALVEAFPGLPAGDTSFHGDEPCRMYLATALNAGAFAVLDRQAGRAD